MARRNVTYFWEICYDNYSPTGDDRDRTGNLRLAKPALSQLSYVPDAKSETRSTKSGKPLCDFRFVRISSFEFRIFLQWGYEDSNFGPQLYQSCALAN